MILCFLPLKICSKQKSDNTFPDEFANTMAVPCIKCNAAVSFLRATFSSRYIAKWYNVFKKKSFCFKKKNFMLFEGNNYSTSNSCCSANKNKTTTMMKFQCENKQPRGKNKRVENQSEMYRNE